MSEWLNKVHEFMHTRFQAEISMFRDETTFWIKAEQIVEVFQLLRDEYEFDMLEDETAVDYWQREKDRFQLVYQLYSYPHNERITIRVPIDLNASVVPSIVSIFPNANWYEREIWDMFGIRFENHPDLRRILMPHDWEGHPLRKDYPLGYEEVMFTFNYDEINHSKPHAKRYSEELIKHEPEQKA